MGHPRKAFEAGPCEHCVNRHVCEESRLACERFAYYAETGRVKVRYQIVPLKTFYERMYYGTKIKKEPDT